MHLSSSIQPTALSVTGPSGGLTIPNGRLLPDGAAAFGFNNYIDPAYPQTRRGEHYLFGFGLLPYVEISGRLTHYLIDAPPGYRPRDLSANGKFMLPRFFREQPDIAIGRNDLRGGAPLFKSTYVAVSKDFGVIDATLGRASGESYLSGWFGGVEYRLPMQGASALIERNNKTNHIGVRYASQPMTRLANAKLVGTVQRSFGARAPDGSTADRTAVAINLIIPFGENARTVKKPEPASDAIWTPPAAYRKPATAVDVTANGKTDVADAVDGGRQHAGNATGLAQPIIQSHYAQSSTPSATASESEVQGSSKDGRTAESEPLRVVQTALEKQGFERVRVGRDGSRLVVEYENHRYNRNEVDAIGIVLALAVRYAPGDVTRVSAVTKKAGLPIYQTSVDRVHYRRFLDDGDRYEAMEGLDVQLRSSDNKNVHWLDAAEGKRGFSRIMIEPVLKSFVATELGVFDYSLAASVSGMVPLWTGAEAHVSYVHHLSDSDDVKDGQFSYAHQRSGVRSALLSQSLWLTDRLLNVTSIGRFQYNYSGVQNETIFFVPGRADQVRLQYSRIRYADPFLKSTLVNMGAFYRWTYQPLNLWVEAGYNQYTGNDRGPSLQVSRWFGDVEAQGYMRRSDQATFIGFRLAFPLTPRQGAKPGYTHVEGPGRFAYGLETKLASVGDCNCIASVRDVAEEIPFVYSARSILLNRGRIGKEYVASQLLRMREAALLYAPFE